MEFSFVLDRRQAIPARTRDDLTNLSADHFRAVPPEGSTWHTPSPVAPLLHMNIDDACVILTEHAHHHLAQVERARRAAGG